MQYPRSGRAPRSTVCVSTQAGCAMGCVFCATGQMGFERNIPAEDIVAQVLHFQRLLAPRGGHVTNVVFMGMGEPLANYDETVRAVRQLTDPRAFDLAQRAITVSTVGIPRAIDRLAAEKLQVGLAISLHAPDDPLRRRLVPTARPNSVAELLDAGKRYFRATGRRVSIEYALIDGVNDSARAGAGARAAAPRRRHARQPHPPQRDRRPLRRPLPPERARVPPHPQRGGRERHRANREGRRDRRRLRAAPHRRGRR